MTESTPPEHRWPGGGTSLVAEDLQEHEHSCKRCIQQRQKHRWHVEYDNNQYSINGDKYGSKYGEMTPLTKHIFVADEEQVTQLRVRGQGEQGIHGGSNSKRRTSIADRVNICFVGFVSAPGAAQRIQNSTARRSGSAFRIRSGSQLFLVLVLLLCRLGTPNAQLCSPDSDCHPVAEDLLVQNLPSRTLITSSQCDTPTATVYEDLFGEARYECNRTTPHPSSLMIDRQPGGIANYTFQSPDPQTYWQSVNTIELIAAPAKEQTIVARFGSRFLIRYIRVIFIAPHITSPETGYDMRPKAMVIEKLDNSTSNWMPLRYYADNCATRFPNVTVDTRSVRVKSTDVVCQQKYYAQDSNTYTGWGYARQEVKFTPGNEFEQQFAEDYQTQKYFMATAIRFRLVEPAVNDPLRSYYAVADLEIDGVCSCFGHAAVCTGENRDVCQCEHNTFGPHCEACLPLFNNKPWRVASNGQSNACEDCGCSGHASLCHYDEDKGYGVCDDCTQNTAGDKCDQCIEYYYINPDKDKYNQTNPAPDNCSGYNGLTDTVETYNCGSWCIPCNCDQNGTLASSGYNCDSATGQCRCKMYVQGRACDQCADGYWNLRREDVANGCTACKCNAMGTVNNTNICDKITGDCICKANTEGSDCGECKVGYYGMDYYNPDGCTPCDCDPGGSLDPVCPASGQCDCRPNLSGKTCSTPVINYYLPPLDQLTFDAEYSPTGLPVVEQAGHGELNGTVTGRGYLQVPSSQQFTLSASVPSTTDYNVVIRYKVSDMVIGSKVILSMVDSTPGQSYVCGNSSYPEDENITLASSSLLATGDTGDALIIGSACLLANKEYTVTVMIGTTLADNVLVDSIVLLPVLEDLTVFNNATTQVQAEIRHCYEATVPVDLALRANLSCDQYEFSLMTELYGGAVECRCSGIGVLSSVCEPRGGQCPCKPGVMLKGCTECMVDHYGFTSGAGCTPCNCHPTGSVKTSCNDTGICECRSNVIGVKCDSCLPEYYGLSTGQGCVLCVCDEKYSVNKSCEDSGQCYCKPGIGGVTCSECLPGFYNLTVDGCTPCGCDPDGSTGSVCDPVTGKCSCKPRVTGDKCDMCQDTYFGVGPWNAEGCLKCFCSGHSESCSVASPWYYAVVRNTWDLTGPAAVEGKWTGVDGQDKPIKVDVVARFDDFHRAEYVMSVKDGDYNAGRDNLYFLATNSFLGDKRGAYGQNISFTMAINVPEVDANTTVDYINDTKGDVILVGNWTTYTLVNALPSPLTENRTTYLFKFFETDWHINTIDGPNPSYVEMLQVLAGIKAIKVRAKYNNVNDTIVDLYAVTMYYSAPEASSLEQTITNVEDCRDFCPPQYTGQFCEQCAPGYKRVDPELGPYSQCKACECNKHDFGPCDPETGLCNCTHSTTGDKCEFCVEGYYGDATKGTPGDCQPCLCPGSIPEGAVNAFAATCEADPGADSGFRCVNCTEGHGGDHCQYCLDHWYGEPDNEFNNFGSCQPCSCNGRADTCNSTSGMCIDCRNNTAGQHCDICASGYTGRAPSCNPCDCNSSIGATGNCDPFTGECECKPNVIGIKCDQCAFDAYNIQSGQGCEKCDCHPVGSSSKSCDPIIGQCRCRQATIVGRRCDQCIEGFWNIRLSGCMECGCTEEGTAPGNKSCDILTGQCHCANEGIIGRTCNQCAKGTTGIYPECKLCGECYDNWAKKIDGLGIELTSLYQQAMDIWKNYGNLTYEKVAPLLDYMTGNLSAVESSVIIAKDMMSQLNYLKDGFQQASLEAMNQSDVADNITNYGSQIQTELANNRRFTGLVQINNTHRATPGQLLAYTTSAYDRLQTLYTAANQTWNLIENQTKLIQQSNGNIDIFLASVTTAMVTLGQATSTRRVADIIVAGEFVDQYTANAEKLTELQGTIDGYPAAIGRISEDVRKAEDMTTRANQTANYATSTVKQKQAQMSLKVLQAERAKNNATQAQITSTEAKAAVDTFHNLANLTKLQMSKTLLDVVRGLRTLDRVQEDVLRSMEIETNTSLVRLRPLQDMRDITLQIASTQVSPENVTRTLQAAENGLQVAADAKNVTELALEESQSALDTFNSIKGNLSEIQTLNNQTKAELDEITAKNSSVNQMLAEVTSKALDTQELADQTRSSINSLLSFINTISQCLTTADADLRVISSTLRTANATVQAAGQSVLANQNKAGDLRTPISEKLSDLEMKYRDVTQLQTDVKALTSDLDEVTQIVDLQRMLNEYTAQRLEMTALLAELNTLEGQLDALSGALNLLDPKDTTCVQ